MKKFFSLLSMLCMSMVVFAQNTLVATLSHGEDITMYYGTNALKKAHSAAVSGDVINLSGGAFQAVNITKGISLRGTGIDDASPSYITGDFSINVAKDDANRLSMEGIRCTGTITMKGTFDSPYFVKSAFYAFEYSSSPTIHNAMFANCRIRESYTLEGSSTVQFINSYVAGFDNENQNNTAASFINCVIFPYGLGSGLEYIGSSQLLNCIIYQTYSLLSTKNRYAFFEMIEI